MPAVDADFAPFPYYQGVPNNCSCSDVSAGTGTSSGANAVVSGGGDSKLGTDIDGITDTGSMLTLAAGLRNVGNAFCRRLTTPRGALFYDPTYGFDVRAFLNAGFTVDQLSKLQDQIAAEIEKDERVQSASATVDFDIAAMTMTIAIVVELTTGPFQFIIAVDKLTANLLSAEALN